MRLSVVAARASALRRFKTWASRRFLARVQRATHRVPVELRPVEKARVLVLAPHVDDEAVGAGGTLALYRRAGSEVAVVYTSDSAGKGGPAEAAARAADAAAVAQLFGFEVLAVLPHPEGNLSRSEGELARDLMRWLGVWKPERVFVPFPGDHHQDHQATAVALASAIEAGGWGGEVWCYEVWSTLWPNVEVDVTVAVEAKREMIGLYGSRVGDAGFAESVLGLNRYRGLKVRVPYAEAFHVCPAAEYVRLAASLREV